MAKKSKKKSFGWRGQIVFIVLIIAGIMFSSISAILAVGMIPTLVAAVVDRTEWRLRTATIGVVNFAGCVPFMIEVFKKGNSLETAMSYIMQPQTIVVMYAAAAIGYVIDWAMGGIVSSLMVQKAKGRIKDLRKRQEALSVRWGQEVTGNVPLDEYGFAIKDVKEKIEESPAG